jgi:ribosomal protein S4
MYFFSDEAVQTVDAADLGAVPTLAPRWLERDVRGLAGKVLQAPERQDVDATLNEQLIVEFYSR